MVEYIEDEENVRVSEARYYDDNGVTVRIGISSDGTYTMRGCQWPATWSDKNMSGLTLDEEEIELRKADAKNKANSIINKYNE